MEECSEPCFGFCCVSSLMDGVVLPFPMELPVSETHPHGCMEPLVSWLSFSQCFLWVFLRQELTVLCHSDCPRTHCVASLIRTCGSPLSLLPHFIISKADTKWLFNLISLKYETVRNKKWKHLVMQAVDLSTNPEAPAMGFLFIFWYALFLFVGWWWAPEEAAPSAGRSPLQQSCKALSASQRCSLWTA